MDFPHGDCLTVHRDVLAVNAYGDLAPTGSTSHMVGPVAVFVSSSRETFEAGRSATVTTATVYGPVDADIRHGDRFEWCGQWFRAEGDAMRRRNPFTGWEAGSETVCELVEG